MGTKGITRQAGSLAVSLVRRTWRGPTGLAIAPPGSSGDTLPGHLTGLAVCRLRPVEAVTGVREEEGIVPPEGPSPPRPGSGREQVIRRAAGGDAGGVGGA